MNRNTALATVMALAAATAFAQGQVAPPTAGRTAPGVQRPATIKVQVGGKITWSGNVALKPGSGDACSHFKVRVLEPVPGTTTGGLNLGPTGKDLGVSVKGIGNIAKGSCSYVIGSGVPEGKEVYVSASYDGSMGSAADSKTGASAPFSLGGGKSATQDLQVAFTQIK